MTFANAEKERILIVDDTPANIDVLGAILVESYDVSVAVNGHMALDIVESSMPPDLILLDIMMPEMDGYEVARRLKANKKTSSIPVIFVTAKIDEADEAFGFEIGAVDYIRKPVNASVTLARIKSQLELKRYHDHLARMVANKNYLVKESRCQLEIQKNKLSKAAVDMKTCEVSAHKNQVYFRELFMNSPHGIILVGPDNKIINTNRSFAQLVGYDIGEILGEKSSVFSVTEGVKEDNDNLISKALGQGSVSVETRCVHKNGLQINVSALAYPVKIDNQVQGVFVFYENISQRKLLEEKLRHQAFHDALTGIPNRLLFSERLHWAIERQKNEKEYKFAVLLMDLDRFKTVNDSLGHQVGDKLLKSVTTKIQSQLRAKDIIARLGGDEFAVLLSDIENRTEVESIASRIRMAAQSTFVIDGNDVHVSISIGIVIDTRCYENANLMLRDADLAMYHAKDSGRAQYKIFSRKMHDELMTSITIEKELRKAIESNAMSLHFQPIVNVATGILDGFEALIRWNHPEQGMIMPDSFISVAEETGLIVPLGEWIIDEACRHLKIFHAKSPDLSMSINVSVRQFLQENFLDHLSGAVLSHGLAPASIKLEFTESLLMEQTSSAIKKLNALKSQGFHLVIDDFGTGYSSLSYLQQFPIDQIKIDRSFVNSMGARNDSFEIVKSVLSLSKSLGLTTVAEGVETLEQLNMLSDLACESAQGYYFSKPIPAEVAINRLGSQWNKSLF